jgi:molybdenum cofactor cytidylyltransferase
MSLDLPDTTLVFNDQPERGMFSSVLLGLNAVSGEVDGILVQPVDCPLVNSRVPEALCHKAEVVADSSALVPTYQGQRGHPVWLAWKVARALRGGAPTGSLRESLAAYPVTEVPVDAPEVLANLNTPEDVLCWRLDGRNER